MDVPKIQPLEMQDFSGGLTENILQGDPRRFAAADNLQITIDKKLEERDGLIVDSLTSYLITEAAGQRINGYFTFHNESVLMPQSGRNIYYKNTSDVWTRVPGYLGRETLSGGDDLSQTTFGEFQRVIYLATDGEPGINGVLPSKMYIDDTGNWVSRTVGLPRAYSNGNYNDQTLLLKCIQNANLIRASMLAHILDSQNLDNPTAFYQVSHPYAVSPGFLHANLDKYALSYFQTVAFNADPNRPSPIPTPAPAATNTASLYALITALNAVYVHHTADAMLNSWGTHPQSTILSAQVFPKYHQDPPVFTYAVTPVDFPTYKTKGPAAVLASPGTPDTLLEAAAMLDDLWQKWTWHQLAVNTHERNNDYFSINKYRLVGSKIGIIQEGATAYPTITPDWGDITGYVNNLKYIYNSHVTNNPGTTGNGVHKMRDNGIYNNRCEVTLPDATDLDSAFLNIWWMRSLYQMHRNDADRGNAARVFYTATAATGNLSAMTFFGGGATSGITGTFFQASAFITNQLAPVPNRYGYLNQYGVGLITVSASGTATIDGTFLANAGPTAFGEISPSMYHSAYDTTGNFTETSASIEPTTSALSVDVTVYGIDTESWLALASDLYFSMSNHMQSVVTHVGTTLNQLTYTNNVAAVPYPNFYMPDIAEVAYAVYFSHDYVVEPNGVEYLVQGNPVFSASTEVAISFPLNTVPENLTPTYYPEKPILTQRANVLSNLPVLVNDITTSYDVANVKLNIYRTTNGGQTFFLLAQVPNGTTSYTDIINDSLPNPGDTALNTRETLYTSGGVVGFDQPPFCKYVHILNGVTYWGAITDSGQFFPNRIIQSIKSAPDAAPATFSDDLDSPIMGISSTRNNPIVLCQNSIYRISGLFTSQGQGSIIHENISDTLGCLNAKGIVRTELGVFFPGDDGFYYTDGYQVIPLTLELKKTYESLTSSAEQRRKIYGAYDRIHRKVWWSLCENPGGDENSVSYSFYLDYGVKPSGTFTLMRNGLNYRPASMVFQNGQMFVGDGRGYLLKSDPDTKTDVNIDSTVGAASWTTDVIPYNFTSCAVDMGTTFNRKYLTKMHIVGKNSGNMGIQPYALRDLNQTGQGAIPLAPVNYRDNKTWGDARQIWGDTTEIWKTDGKMDVWRRFPRNTLRSDFMQIQLKPANICVYSSSNDYPDFCYATIFSGPKLCGIITPAGYSQIVWPNDVVGYTIRFQTDDYTVEYPIVGISGIYLTLSDPLNTLVDVAVPGIQWEIWGVKKEQRLTITSILLHFAYLGDKNQAYPGDSSSAGPGNGGQNP